MATVPVPDEATWLSLRESHVGGSEIASLFYRWMHLDGTTAVYHLYEEPPAGSTVVECLSPHTTGYRLWQQKSGILRPDDLDEVERVQAGNFLEPALAAWAGDKWGWKLRKVRRYMRHDDVAGWGASLDYEAVETGMPPVEFKNVDFLIYRDKWVEFEGEIIMPPLNYSLQLQHQIGAAKADHGWVVACVGGNRLVRGRIERHEPTQERIAEAVAQFWRGVAMKVEPTWVADYETVAELYRDGPGSEKPVDLSDDLDLAQLCIDYKTVKGQADLIDAHLDNLKGQIAARIGEASKVLTAGYRLSWPVIQRPEKVIPEKLQKAITYRGGLTITEAK